VALGYFTGEIYFFSYFKKGPFISYNFLPPQRYSPNHPPFNRQAATFCALHHSAHRIFLKKSGQKAHLINSYISLIINRLINIKEKSRYFKHPLINHVKTSNFSARLLIIFATLAYLPYAILISCKQIVTIGFYVGLHIHMRKIAPANFCTGLFIGQPYFSATTMQ